MPNLPSSATALIHSSQKINPETLAKYTGAVCIQWKENSDGWVYILEAPSPQPYDEWRDALEATEAYIKVKCFLPILDDSGSTDGRIILNPPSKLQSARTWKPKQTKQNDKPFDAVSVFAEKALEAVVKSHAEAIASKDETIRALTSALASRDEIIETQGALIVALQR
jgi:hypothetical protein